MKKTNKVKASVVICTYNDDPLILKKCIQSVISQEVQKEVLIIDMSTKKEIYAICKQFKTNLRYTYFPNSIGLSDSRNKGVTLSKSDFVVFLDADAIPKRNWLKSILSAFKFYKNTAVVGGKIVPSWPKRTLSFIRKANQSGAFYSCLDLSSKLIKVQRIIGANFAINKRLLGFIKFDTRLGRSRDKLLGGEEMYLCNLALKKGYNIVYTPFAIVQHCIRKNRTKIGWIIKKSVNDGFSKGLMHTRPNPIKKTINFYDLIFLLLITPPYMIGYAYSLLKNRNRIR